MTVRVVVSAEAGVAPPLIGLEVRDDGGLVLASASRATSELGWNGAAGERELRFHVGRLPLADGRFHLRVALTDPVSGLPLHALDDALRLFVFPSGESTGAVLLDGDWTMEETGPGAPIGRA